MEAMARSLGIQEETYFRGWAEPEVVADLMRASLCTSCRPWPKVFPSQSWKRSLAEPQSWPRRWVI